MSPPPYAGASVLLFGCTSSEKVSMIRSLVRRSKHSYVVRRFLQDATDAIELEYARLSHLETGWKGSFKCLMAVAEENEKAPHGIVDAVLMCVGRIGQLIMHTEDDHTLLGPSSRLVKVVGLCTGLLPAVLAVAARDTLDLVSLAPGMLQIAVRFFFQLWCRMTLVDLPGEGWTETYAGIDEGEMQDIIDNFHRIRSLPTSSKVHIGIVARNWITLCGPPSSLKLLRSSSVSLQETPRLNSDRGGGAHLHFIPMLDIDTIIGSEAFLDRAIDDGKTRIPRPSGVGHYDCATIRELLREVLVDIAQSTLRVSETISTSVDGIKSSEAVRVITMGTTIYEKTLENELQRRRITFKTISEPDGVCGRSLRRSSDDIAIVGMAGRFAHAEDLNGFWDELVGGKCHITKVPIDRFDVNRHYDPTLKKKNSTSAVHGAWLDDADVFDHRLFNISPREAQQMDPIHRLLLTVSYEALQMSGYSPDTSLTKRDRIATYFGQLAEDWHDIVHQEGADVYYAPGIARAFAPGRLNFHYKWGGGSYAVDSACASSTTAIILACEALAARKCDMALSGGGNLMLTPVPFSGLSRSGMISPGVGCRAFHDDADGYTRGEGIGVVVLKRLEDAIMENDNILGIITGASRASSTTSRSITHPSHISQQKLYADVLGQAGIDATDIDYVEMHATGTQAGDVEEMASVIHVLSKPRDRRKHRPLVLGTLKPAFGHCEAAAGVMALIKTVLMLKHRRIPPQPCWPFTINRRFPDLERCNVQIPTAPMPLLPTSGSDRRLRLMINNFDATGGESCIVLEEPPNRAMNGRDPRKTHVVAISAHTKNALRLNRQRLLKYLDDNSGVDLSHLSYTTTARRLHESLRTAYVGGSVREIRDQLLQSIESDENPTTKHTQRKLCAFVFSGQGSQYPGMGAQLFEELPPFRECIRQWDDAVQSMGFPSFIDIISSPPEDMTAVQPVRMQLAIVALELAMAHVLAIWGISPDVVIGHSLGEYAALCTAGVLSKVDVLWLVGNRAMLLEQCLQAGTHALLAVRCGPDKLQKLINSAGLQSSCEISCYNSTTQTVVSGPLPVIPLLKKTLISSDIRSSVVDVPYAFHSSQVDAILDKFRSMARDIQFRRAKIPICSTVTGTVESGIFSPDYLMQQAREPVRFVAAVRNLADSFTDRDILWYGIGPGATCLKLVEETLVMRSEHLLPTMRKGSDAWTGISELLAAAYEGGISLRWLEYHKSFEHNLRLLELPTYGFDYRRFPARFREEDEAVAVSRRRWTPTTSVHAVLEQSIDEKGCKATFSANAKDSQLRAAIEGHLVAGHALCPSSVFIDMALTATAYCRSQLLPDAVTPQMGVQDFEVSKAIVLKSEDECQPPLIIVKCDLQRSLSEAEVSFWTRDDEDKDTSHATCRVVFQEAEGNGRAVTTWLDGTAEVVHRVEDLRQRTAKDATNHITSHMIYKLFAASAVSYSRPYRGMKDVSFTKEGLEAVASVHLTTDENLGSFMLSPYWLDALTHLPGFLLNATCTDESAIQMAVKFDKWENAPSHVLCSSKTYTTYARMRSRDGPGDRLSVLDCYILDGTLLVSKVTGLYFQKVKTSALIALLSDQMTLSSSDRSLASSGLVTDRCRDIIKSEDSPHSIQDGDPAPPPSASPVTDSSLPSTLNDSHAVLQYFRQTVARESGCDVEELEPDTLLDDIGVDSLMCLVVLGAISRETGVKLPSTLLVDNPTIALAEAAIQKHISSKVPELKSSCKVSRPERDCITAVQEPPVQCGQPDRRAEPHLSTSLVHLRGPEIRLPQSPASQCLFLMPDSLGSCVPYLQLAYAERQQISIYGLMHSTHGTKSVTEDYTSVHGLAVSYVVSIRDKRPHGPYHLGGWSLGAAVALEVARLLAEAGEEIAGLLLIDPALECLASHCTGPDAIVRPRIAQVLTVLLPREHDDVMRTTLEVQLGGVPEYIPTNIRHGAMCTYDNVNMINEAFCAALKRF